MPAVLKSVDVGVGDQIHGAVVVGGGGGEERGVYLFSSLTLNSLPVNNQVTYTFFPRSD